MFDLSNLPDTAILAWAIPVAGQIVKYLLRDKDEAAPMDTITAVTEQLIGAKNGGNITYSCADGSSLSITVAGMPVAAVAYEVPASSDAGPAS